MNKDYKPISDEHLLALRTMAESQKEYLECYADAYAALSELIERRKASGEWSGRAEK